MDTADSTSEGGGGGIFPMATSTDVNLIPESSSSSSSMAAAGGVSSMELQQSAGSDAVEGVGRRTTGSAVAGGGGAAAGRPSRVAGAGAAGMRGYGSPFIGGSSSGHRPNRPRREPAYGRYNRGGGDSVSNSGDGGGDNASVVGHRTPPLAHKHVFLAFPDDVNLKDLA